MPRYARSQSTSGIYHVMIRGNERKQVFMEDDDRVRFLDTLERMQEDGRFRLYAYCLMDNHVHLLLCEGKESVQRTMKRIEVSYVYYFNKKYQRVGHLFQDRYRSEAVEENNYVLTAARYIHNNPVKAEMVARAEDYKWSSYRYYIGLNRDKPDLVHTDFLLNILSDKNEKAVKLLKEYTGQMGEESFIEYTEEKAGARGQDSFCVDTKKVITEILDKYGLTIEKLANCRDRLQRNFVLREIKESSKASVRELSRLLKISKDKIFRA